jgi:hypothetical protein
MGKVPEYFLTINDEIASRASVHNQLGAVRIMNAQHRRIAELETEVVALQEGYRLGVENINEDVLAERDHLRAEVERLSARGFEDLTFENKELRGEVEGLEEAREILDDTLNSEDFQPQYSARQHMTGPALRGNIERALAALTPAAEDNDPVRMGCHSQCRSNLHAAGCQRVKTEPTAEEKEDG